MEYHNAPTHNQHYITTSFQAPAPNRSGRRRATVQTASMPPYASPTAQRQPFPGHTSTAMTGTHKERSAVPDPVDTRGQRDVPAGAVTSLFCPVAGPVDTIGNEVAEDGWGSMGSGGSFVCEEVRGGERCGQVFRRQWDLDRHIRSIHERRLPACPRCGKTYSRVDALQRHLEETCGQGKKRGPKPRTGRDEIE